MSRYALEPWAERYDRGLTDVFAVQDDITGSIVAAIEPQVCCREFSRAAQNAGQHVDAWDLVMRRYRTIGE